MTITTQSVNIFNFVFDILKLWFLYVQLSILYSNNRLTVWFGNKNYCVKVRTIFSVSFFWCHKHGRKVSAHLAQKYPVLLLLKMQKMS